MDTDLYVYQRDLFHGYSIWVYPRLFNATIIYGPTNSFCYDSHWCYTSEKEAIQAAEAWDPFEDIEPEGWFRHASTGRRRVGGDKSTEYIAF